jgi:hypothetical protein
VRKSAPFLHYQVYALGSGNGGRLTNLVNARRLIRKMRGKSHAHLIEADDGFAYVVKLSNNPQGRRLLVNELIGSVLLTQLGIATPERGFVRIDDQCMNEGDPLTAGVHFGSRYPGEPDTVAVYDFLPAKLWHRVSNREHLIGAFMVDQWAGNNDTRQAIFFRQTAKPDEDGATGRPFFAQMIDNGALFRGSDWEFPESVPMDIRGLGAVGRFDLCAGDFDPWLDVLAGLGTDMLDEAAAEVPADWIAGDAQVLEELLVRLYERRSRVPVMIQQAIHSRRAKLRLPPRTGVWSRSEIGIAG